MGIRNKNININKKQKIIGLYTEYDSKINNKNIRIQKKCLFKNKENNLKKIDFRFFKTTEKMNQRKKLLNKEEFDSININKKASLESSRFINYNIIKEKASDLTLNSNLNIINRDKLKGRCEPNYEIEFEDYITKLNSEDFNIDKELSERPLFNLINNYQYHSNLYKQTKNCLKYDGDKDNILILHETNSSNNNKNKIPISSLTNIFNVKQTKKHKIFLDKIKTHYNLNKKYKILNNRNDKHKINFLIKTENNYKTESSTSANSKSKFLNVSSS